MYPEAWRFQRVCGELLILGKSVIRHTQVAKKGQAAKNDGKHLAAAQGRKSFG